MLPNIPVSNAAAPKPSHKPKNYRPEIDGLRAFAVVSVIIYHADSYGAGTPVLTGGFLGVDIFFVISGFLITTIILRELQTTNRFSFARFYERRARRILPALFAVMLASLPFAWIYMSPSALVEFAGSGLSSLFFGSNIWFWQENTYTAQISQLKPFLHTWTLSVEEQFYVFFPILMILTWKFFKRWALLILIVLGLASLQLAEFSSSRYSDANFYLLPTRGWELLAGSILAFIRPPTLAREGVMRVAGKIAPTAGIVMIVASFFLFNDTMRHPSYITMVPILGTVLLIWFSSPDEWMTRLLSGRVLVGIGLISYSLYLWHFPVFAFARLSDLPPTVLIKFILVALSVILATLTYFFIETPFRRKETMSPKLFSWVTGLTFLGLVGVFLAIYTGRALPEKYAKAQNFIDFSYAYQPVFREGTCFLAPKDMEPFASQDGSKLVKPFDNCELESASPDKPTLYLWGDSHAAHLYAGYKAVLGDKYNIVQRTASACTPIPGKFVSHRPGCREINDDVFEEISDAKPDRVVLAAYWGGGSANSMRETLESLRAQGIQNIEIVGPIPRWDKSLPVVLSEKISAGERVPTYLSENLQPGVFDVEKEWRQFAARENYIYQSPIEILCRNEACLTRVEAGPTGIVQWDTAHLTKLGSEYVVSRFDAK